MPHVVVIAGPNGAGKSSAAPALLQGTLGVDTFVNADVIAQGLSGFAPESAAVRAGRIMLAELDELARRRKDFAFETTLSGRALRGRWERWLAARYAVHLVYLWLPSADLAVSRVAMRVRAGGHDVPEDVIRRRFAKSLSNFAHVYRPVATTWNLYDGSAPLSGGRIAHGSGEMETVLDSPRWERFEEQLRGISREENEADG